VKEQGLSELSKHIGLPTYHTRVEPWECDHNNHWNTKFYGRSFDIAATSLQFEWPDLARLKTNYHHGLVRHMRMHRELFLSSAVEVRSSCVDGEFLGHSAIFHVLLKNETVSATAIDYWPAGDAFAIDSETLVKQNLDDVPLALPRTVLQSTEYLREQHFGGACCTVVGAIDSCHKDQFGYLHCEEIMHCVGVSNSRFMNNIGFGLEDQREAGQGLMAVENRIVWHKPFKETVLVKVFAKISFVSEKSFTLNHYFVLPNGDLVASVEIVQLCVDLTTRKVVKLPSLVQDTA
jgi:acyl-CoA thioesterase FadM